MKRKVVVLGIVICTIICGIILYGRSNLLIQVNNTLSMEEAGPVGSEGSTRLDERMEVTFKYSSVVKKGKLAILLKDENNNVIRVFKSNEKGAEKIVLDVGAYSVRVESDHFMGRYDIKVFK